MTPRLLVREPGVMNRETCHKISLRVRDGKSGVPFWSYKV